MHQPVRRLTLTLGVLVFTTSVAAALAFGWALGRTRSGEKVVRQAGQATPAIFTAPQARANPASPGAPPTPVSMADVAERVLPGVVSIATSKSMGGGDPHGFPFRIPGLPPGMRGPFGQGPRGGAPQQQGLGSGVVVSADGVILTNNHVVSGASEIKVTLSDRREVRARLVGADPRSDVAVVRLTEKVPNLRPIPFGDSSKMRLGDVVLAIGNPMGVGQSVTMGIVSAKGRANVGIVDYEDFIQTDAAINPGNSGGALVNLAGELVGINTAILSRSGGNQGIGFAIPTNMARPIMDSLMKNGKVVRGYLGTYIQDVTPALAGAMGLPVKSGVLVSDVEAGGPADQGGLKRGDVILKLNGATLASASQLRTTVAAQAPGSTVTLEVRRGSGLQTLTITLGTLPGTGPGPVTGNNAQPAPTAPDAFGLTVANLSDATRRQYQVPRALQGGVVVVEVEDGSAAERAGLEEGDVILEVNRQGVDSTAAFGRAMGQAGMRALLLVARGGRTQYLVIQR